MHPSNPSTSVNASRSAAAPITITAMSAEAPQTDWTLATPVAALPGVGPRRGELFSRLDIATISDLIRHLPMRYERELGESSIDDLSMTATSSARGTVVATRTVGGFQGGGKVRFEATLQDHRDRLQLVWFNAPWMQDQIHPGMVLRVQGKVKPFGGRAQMVNPQWELLDEDEPPAPQGERLRPVYPATEDLPSRIIEQIVATALPAVETLLTDPLADDYLHQRAMPSLAKAYRQAHQPADEDQALAARRRLAYNELLLLQLGIAVKRHYNAHHLAAPALHVSPQIDRHIRDRFPFDLTDSQNQVITEIAADLQHTAPMNRLLQGDVGAGKTVVALYALLLAVADRKQGALMAPTELLAEQHYMSITNMLKGSNVEVALLTAGSSSAASDQRRVLLQRIQAGRVDLVIGTQALLSQQVRFSELAVVVVDEQHRFGVLQRATFRSGDVDRPSATPHYLVMTATPIPRTLSLTIFGDLDVSTIRGLPPGRGPITTRVIGPEKTNDVYDYLAQRLAAGEQAYVVLPAIDESDDDSRATLKNVREQAQLLQEKLPDFRIAAIHGQLDRPTRETIMHRFRSGEIHVLVATTVIEVGVDVPNASMMIIEHAERFGLAQLHQLRGRIGRSSDGRRSVCVLITDPTTEPAEQRMTAIAATQDGFIIAEKDLEIRGMGDFFGTRQHGLAPLRVADIPRDMDLLQMARRDAENTIKQDPKLTAPANAAIRKVLMREYGDTISLIDVG